MASFLQVLILIWSLFVFVSSDIRWEESYPQLPIDLDAAAIGTVDNQITYIIGGLKGPHLYSNAVYKWIDSPSNDSESSWIKLSVTTPQPFACWSQCSITINNELIFIITPLLFNQTGTSFIFVSISNY